jgi:hypothetical protein
MCRTNWEKFQCKINRIKQGQLKIRKTDPVHVERITIDRICYGHFEYYTLRTRYGYLRPIYMYRFNKERFVINKQILNIANIVLCKVALNKR